MAAPLLNLLLTIINIYWWVIIAMAVMSWLVAFQVVDTRNQFVQSAWRALDAMTEPVLRPIRRFVPALGGLDISPVILLLALSFLQDVIRSNAHLVVG
ncbi:MAG: YggT family protein [Rhodoblastus sp.]